MKTRVMIFSIAMWSALGTAKSQNSMNTTLIGQWGYGPCNTVAVNGNYAYIGSGCMLVILDISDPSSPQKLGALALPDILQELTISGNYAYVADSDEGLRIIDITDPALPFEEGFYDIPGE
ncbi:MAG: hypothetical protein MUC31_05780, partial [Bacteroidales bacterium]|nr:hypothetical protein [Bacteroidales bacterium]